MNSRQYAYVLRLLRKAHDALAELEFAIMTSGPESTREEVSPSDRSLQRDCRTKQLVAALSIIWKSKPPHVVHDIARDFGTAVEGCSVRRIICTCGKVIDGGWDSARFNFEIHAGWVRDRQGRLISPTPEALCAARNILAGA